MELIIFCSNAVRVVNEYPITALSEEPKILLLWLQSHCFLLVIAYERDNLRKVFRFIVAQAERFWKE